MCYNDTMKAMILAAGEGTRLRPLTLTVPKPMIPIVGVPLLARTIDWLAGQGVSEVAVNLYHRPQSILDYFGDLWHGVRLHYFCEDVLRGTAGGVKGAEEVLSDAPFYVIYGDNLIDADLRRLASFHAEHDGAASVALFHHPNPSAAGIVGVDAHGRITRFVEKPPPDQVFSDTANAGVYVLDPSVFAAIPNDQPSDFGKDIFPRLLAQGMVLYGTMLGGYLQDTGTPDTYRQANWDMLEDQSTVRSVATTAQIAADVHWHGRNVVGDRVVIESGARLTDCILWEDAHVGAGVILDQAILAGNAQVVARATPPVGILLGESEIFG
jgi:NDP-sugar pyrophosphorylase family protein